MDPAAVARLSQDAGRTAAADIEASLETVAGPVTIPGKGNFSPWCPQQPLLGDFENLAGDPESWWERRMAVAYIFGIHPIFAVMSPEIVEEDLVDIACVGTELEIDQNTLENAVAFLLA